MGRVVVVNFVSIDGVIQSPLSPDEDREGGFAQGGWVPPHSDDIVKHDLVDEYRLLLFPVVLGARKRMFDERGQPTRFRLTDSVVAPGGVLILTYTRDRSAWVAG